MFKRALQLSLAGAMMAMGPLLRMPTTHPAPTPDFSGGFRHRRSRPHDEQPRRKVQRLSDPEFSAVVNQFTNWERNRWAGAGYPGLKGKDVKKVADFLASLRRRDQRARAA